MYARYALVLVCLNNDMTDAAGNVYPSEGKIEHDTYIRDQRLSCGYFGVLWGKSSRSSYTYANAQHWAVARIETNEDLITIDSDENFVKFRSGFVLKIGSLRECAAYISENSQSLKQAIDKEILDCQSDGIIGSKVKTTKTHAFNNGYGGKAICGGILKHAISTGVKGQALTEGNFSHAIALADKGRAMTTGDYSHAFSAEHDSRVHACGEGSVAVTLSDNSVAIASGSQGISIALGEGSAGAAGPGGVLAISYRHPYNSRLRLLVGYTGEGIEAGKMYRVEDGCFVETTKTEVFETI